MYNICHPPPPSHCVPCGIVSHSVIISMSILLYLVWSLVMVHRHIYLDCQEVSGTKKIDKFKSSFEPLLWL